MSKHFEIYIFQPVKWSRKRICHLSSTVFMNMVKYCLHAIAGWFNSSSNRRE